jgi:hypothetical protein
MPKDMELDAFLYLMIKRFTCHRLFSYTPIRRIKKIVVVLKKKSIVYPEEFMEKDF